MIVSVYDFVTGPNLKKKKILNLCTTVIKNQLPVSLLAPIRFSLAGAGAIGRVLKSQTSI